MKQSKKLWAVMLAVFAGTILNAAPDLSAYKPVDPSKNMLKNSGFEDFIVSKNWITNWGKCSDNVILDKTVKHSGASSLKIGNVPAGYAAVAHHLGNIADLKNDLLIRGWIKSENITGSKKSMPFIGLWCYTAQRKNSRTVKLFNIPAGSSDWKYFETVLKLEDFKDLCAKSKPAPATFSFRINIYLQGGWIWVDDLEVIPLEKK